MSNEPLHRWLRDRAKAQRSLAVDRQVSALARVGQVSRSTIQIAEDEVGLDDALTSGVDAEQNGDLTDENLDLSDDNTDLISDFQDDLDWMYEDYDEARSEDSEEIIQLYDDLADAEEHLAEVQAELNEKLSGLDVDLDAASERLTEAVNRVTAAESAIQQAQQDITAAVNAASQAQIEAVFAQGMLTVSASAPTAANAQGKKLGAVWMHRVGTGIATLYELTSVGWTLRPLSETIIPQIAIGTGTYGELDGIRLSARSVTADKVIVTAGQNELWDPTYSAWNTSAWGNIGSSQSGPGGGWDTSFVRPGMPVSQRFHQYPAGTANASLYSAMRAGVSVVNSTNTDRIVYVGDRVGDKLTAYSHWYVDKALPAGMTSISTQIYFYNAAGQNSWNYIGGRTNRADVKIGEWQRIGGTQVTVPAGALYAVIRPTVYFTNGTTQVNDAKFWLGGEEMYWANAGELLVDGAIAARHVATGTFQAVAATIAEAWIRSAHIVDLDVSKLAVTGNASISQAVIEKLYTDVVRAKLLTVTEKIITRDIIATNAIGAAELSGDAINGKTITGAIMRTAASGQRVQFDTNGLRCFNSAGTETARLAASVGGLRLTGALVSEDALAGFRTTLTGGQLQFERLNGQGIRFTIDESGIRSKSSSVPFEIVQEAEGPNSNIVIDAGKNNSIDMMSRVRFLGDETRILWSGAWYMNANQTVALSELISEQHTGIVLAWSDYTSGSANNHTWNYGFVPKSHALLHPGTGLSIPISIGATQNQAVFKYVYVFDDRIDGHAANATAPRNNQVLRYVFGV